jgi:hypothetical protein
MQPKQYSKIIVLVFCLIWVAAFPVRGELNCEKDAFQKSGSIYRICMPPEGVEYNNKLVIWAHGFQDATDSVQIPEDQLSFGGITIPEVITGLGYGFATNSYSKTGLAVVQGSEDIVELVGLFNEYATKNKIAQPEKVFVTGAFEGGLITALLIETYPNLFDAGLAACGPVGDFLYQIKYFGDARATFQYFFRGLIQGSPFNPDPGLILDWESYYENTVKPVVFNSKNRSKLDQWVNVANLPFDPNDKYGSLEITVRDVLRYSVVNINDSAAFGYLAS